jgi:uncharacterized protein YgbK (DUF1537 family)
MQTSVDRIGSSRIIVVADDLTGACDSGIAFVQAGRPMRVLLHASGEQFQTCAQVHFNGERTGLALTTESRNGPPEEARRRIVECMEAITPLLPTDVLFKKIDSAGRGHAGIEISAVLEASSASLALVAPAFPAAGRTVQAGNLNVRDFAGQNSIIPLRDLFPHESASKVQVLATGPHEQVREEIRQALAAGVRVLLCDSITQSDLDMVAAAALHVAGPILYCGSAGLAHALADALPACNAVTPPPMEARSGRTLVFVGTPHSVTDLQVARLQQHSSEVSRHVQRISWTSISEDAVKAVFTAEPVGALILTGGDTAMLVLAALGASCIHLAGEIAPGIPRGVVEGGLAHGCVVITKSGGFGEPTALLDAFNFCERRACETA